MPILLPRFIAIRPRKNWRHRQGNHGPLDQLDLDGSVTSIYRAAFRLQNDFANCSWHYLNGLKTVLWKRPVQRCSLSRRFR